MCKVPPGSREETVQHSVKNFISLLTSVVAAAKTCHGDSTMNEHLNQSLLDINHTWRVLSLKVI